MQNLDIATIVIIAANVIISMKGFSDFAFFEKYKFNIAGIRRGEQIRMFSSAFLHADFSHLLFNMLTLYFFANVVIGNLGVTYFVIIYVASLLVGNLLSFYFHKDEYHYSAIGASGAVMGIVYSSILFEPNILFYGFVPAWLFGMAYLLYSIYGMKKRMGNIGHDAHIGGAIGGYALTLLFAPYLFETSLWIVVLLALPLILLFILHKLGKI
ncbi:rhomboid family intramembrane serine protease [Aequorivita soesokkakensis]|jgi:membrane associated rhomboid family serine protease|uniref:Rhomboid family intramembrane serine protease n=1 Tax=Aequorivita soesokkakensis TaxID=1385699 RepID=A0A1A9LEZ2_9FLAO|nr:rhomboid family intramembrane serine protease [Aequorivita soesokkakensis]OAD91321.1 rhomboid family intramembrane serine protease [Aequorivita soesokkakensis]